MTHDSSRRRWTYWIGALVAAGLALLPCGAYAAAVSVPADLQVPAGHRLFLIGHAIGTQNYVCVATPIPGTGDLLFTWVPYGPQATLFDGRGRQIATHYLSPNPHEGGAPRPTWQHSHDTSAVWAKVVGLPYSGPEVEPGAIPWLLLHVEGRQPGVRGRGRLSDTTYIQRISTSGGTPSAAGCYEIAHIGARQLAPYETDYLFYRAAD